MDADDVDADDLLSVLIEKHLPKLIAHDAKRTPIGLQQIVLVWLFHTTKFN